MALFQLPSPWAILVLATAIKILLVPAYHSTDFEVHRNWLAITYSLPLSKWYTDTTSPWTLDYPPFFAWFERGLAQAAAWADPDMLTVANLGHASAATLAFQRGTVMASEAVLLLATWWATRGSGSAAQRLALAAVALHPGLIMVDHIHFQYNGVLLGVFVASMAALADDRPLLGGVLFAVLLNLKHIFLYAAPIYFVYLLRSYCWGLRGLGRMVLLGSLVLGVFALAFGPFLVLGQAGQIAGRLFPFDRGLVHAYWAPNAWALYAAADKVLAALAAAMGRAQGAGVGLTAGARLTGGLVGMASFDVLPQIGSRGTAILTLAAMASCLLHTLRAPQASSFPAAVLYCTLASFFFGYHVHEKAILMVAVPAAVFAVRAGTPVAARSFFFLSTVGTYSLFPLLFRPEEYATKVLLLVLYTTVVSSLFRRHLCLPALLRRNQRFYLWGLVGVETAATWVLPFLMGTRLPFLPLALVSCYCALGVGAELAQAALSYVASMEVPLKAA